MDNIRVKKESLHDWRSEFQDQVDEGALKLAAGAAVLALPYLAKKFLKPKVDKKIEDARNNLKIGGNRRSGTTNEEVQGGISVQNYSDGVQFNEIETVDIIKAPSLKEVYRTKNPPIKFEDDNRPIKDRPGVQIGPARINPDEPIKKPEPQVPRFPAGQKPSGGKRIPLQSDRVYRPETDNEGNIIPPKLNTRPFTKKPVKLVPRTTTQLDHYDWRNELDNLDEKVKIEYFGVGKGQKAHPSNMTIPKNKKYNGANYGALFVKDTNKKKETVSASYEVDLENMVLQIIEEDITDLYNEGFSYDEVAEFYNVEEDLTEAWGLLAKGAFQGAKMLATKIAPKVIKFAAKRGIKDRKILTKFARNPKNWARANKDIDKVGAFAKELPARVYQSGKALRGSVNKGLLNPAKNVVGNVKAAKRAGDLAVIRQQIKGNIATNNPRIQAAANKFSTKTTKTTKPKFTKSKVKPELNRVTVTPTQARAAVQSSKSTAPNITASQARAAVEAGSQKVAKTVLKPKPVHVPRQKITQRGNEELLKLQGKSKKQLKAKEIYDRMDRAVSSSKKPGTISNKTDKLISQIRNDKGSALVKSKSDKLTTTSSTAIKPKSKTTSITKSKTKTEKPASKSTVDVKATEVGKGSKATQKKIKMAREWQALNKAAGATLKADKAKSISNASGAAFFGLAGLEAGLNVGKKLGKKKKVDVSSAPDSPKDEPKGVIPNEKKKEEKKSENKTISNTEKKKVDPKKNTVIKSKTEKEKKDENRAKVKANTEKYLKKTKDKIKKYGTSGSHLSPLEQEMAEGVAAVASKLPWGKIAGAVMTTVGAKGILQSKKSDPAFDHVFGKLKDKYGDGVIGKGETAKPWGTPKQQADAKAKKDKADKEEAAFQKRNPPVTSGRYPKDDKAAQDAARKAEAETPKRGLKDKRQSKRPKFDPDSNMTKNQQKRMKQAGLM